MKKVILLAIAISPSYGFSYEVETHRFFSETAIEKSSVSSGDFYLKKWGLPDSNLMDIVIDDGSISGLKVKKRIGQGAVDEDDGTRSLNHFYNPIDNSALSLAIPLGGQPSADWVLDDLSSPSRNKYTFDDAVDQYFNFLTTRFTSTDNKKYTELAELFYNLGFVIHHIQDMAQPEHVRNDQHLKFPLPFTDYLIPIDPSYYEEYTLAQTENIGSDFYNLVVSANSPVYLSDARAYWDSESGDGIAEFTNSNFVSNDTNFVLDENLLDIDPDFPLPSPSGLNYQSLTELLPNRNLGRDICENLIRGFQSLSSSQLEDVCRIQFVETDVNSKQPSPIISKNDRASTVSFFDRRLERYGKSVRQCSTVYGERVCRRQTKRITTLNRFNFEAAYQFLAPAAVNYSVGLIDYFFRGKLSILGIENTGNSSSFLINLQNNSSMGARDFDISSATFHAVCAEQDAGSFRVFDLELVGSERAIPFEGEFQLRMNNIGCRDIIIIGNGLIGQDRGVAVGRFIMDTGEPRALAQASFSELVFAAGNLTRTVTVQGYRYFYSESGEFLRAEEIDEVNTEILSSGTKELSMINDRERLYTYDNYIDKKPGCTGGCPWYIINGSHRQEFRLTWVTIDSDLTFDPIDVGSYLKNSYPISATDDTPLGSEWGIISEDLSGADRYTWSSYFNLFEDGPKVSLNAAEISFNGGGVVDPPIRFIRSY